MHYDYIRGYKPKKDFTWLYVTLSTFLLLVTMYQLAKTYKLQEIYLVETKLTRQVLDEGVVFMVDDSAKQQLKDSNLLMLRSK